MSVIQGVNGETNTKQLLLHQILSAFEKDVYCMLKSIDE